MADEDDFFVTDEDPQPYLSEPEYTEEELHVLEAERARREAKRYNVKTKHKYLPRLLSV